MIRKVTCGFVVQEFEDNGKFIRQEFVASDDVSLEDEDGQEVSDEVDCQNFYFPFDMKNKKGTR